MILQLGTVLRNILSSCSRISSKNIERNSFVSHGTFAHENGLCPLFLTHQYDAHYCPQRSAVFGSSVTHHSTAVSGTRFRSRAQSPSLITNSSPWLHTADSTEIFFFFLKPAFSQPSCREEGFKKYFQCHNIFLFNNSLLCDKWTTFIIWTPVSLLHISCTVCIVFWPHYCVRFIFMIILNIILTNL